MGNHRRPATFRSLGDGSVGLWVAFDDRELARQLPGARWDASLKCWRVPRAFAHEAARLIDKLNGPGDIVLVDAFAALFKRTPPQIRDRVYRALAKAVHPDTGGDTETMKALIAGWAEAQQ